MPALLALFRMAIPFAATIFGGYFISDVFNERMRAKQAQEKGDYPVIIPKVLKKRAAFWQFLAVAGLIFGMVIAFLTKRFGK